jgi:predicted O-linked N-acetylglucosamine transferase (SPINDLY family)
VELAGDLPRLKDLRKDLRGWIEDSPLMDANSFAAAMEAAYRQMWEHWARK